MLQITWDAAEAFDMEDNTIFPMVAAGGNGIADVILDPTVKPDRMVKMIPIQLHWHETSEHSWDGLLVCDCMIEFAGDATIGHFFFGDSSLYTLCHHSVNACVQLFGSNHWVKISLHVVECGHHELEPCLHAAGCCRDAYCDPRGPRRGPRVGLR